MEKSASADDKTPPLLRVAPGLRNLLGYQREWLRLRISRGGSVADGHRICGTNRLRAGGGPVCGDPPVAGDAIFGTSRHLIVNPNAAT
jgi:hypothetical protein